MKEKQAEVAKVLYEKKRTAFRQASVPVPRERFGKKHLCVRMDKERGRPAGAKNKAFVVLPLRNPLTSTVMQKLKNLAKVPRS